MVLEEFVGVVSWAAGSILSKIDFYEFILPLILYTAAIAVYAIFVWMFYKSVSRRDLFNKGIVESIEGRILRSLAHVLKYFVGFPILTFLWFGMLTILLFFISKSLATGEILLVAVAVVAGIRAAAYYNEGLSEDIAKILPLAVLGIFLVDPTFFSIDLVYQRLLQIPGLLIKLFNYLVFVIILEFTLRILFSIKRRISPVEKGG
jgi:hypothetical protein